MVQLAVQAAFDIVGERIHRIPEGEAFDAQCYAILLGDHRAVAVDIETNTIYHGIGPNSDDYGLSYIAEVITITFAWRVDDDPDNWPVQTVAWYSEDGIWPERVQQFLRDLFTSTMIIVAHNAIFDMRGLSKVNGGVTPAKVWCTKVMDRLLAPYDTDPSRKNQLNTLRRFDLLTIAGDYGIPIDPNQIAMKANRKKIASMPIDEVMEYAALDSKVALEIYEWQYDIATAGGPDLIQLVRLEIWAMAEYSKMVAKGVRVNIPFAQKRIAELSVIREKAKLALAKDGLANPNSSKAKSVYIYQTKRIPVLPNLDNPDHADLFTKSGAYSTKAAALELLADLSPENADAIADLLMYARTDDLIGTIESFIDHAALDGRIHSMITIDTAAGRRGSSHPNVQNLSMAVKHKQVEAAGTMAGILIGDDGHSLSELDYSNAESFMAGMSAADNAFMRALTAINPVTGKADFHREMAQTYYGIRFTNATADEQEAMRQAGKGVTFGGAYGAGAEKLSIMLGCTKEEAQAILNNRDRTFSATAAARSRAGLMVKKSGFVTLWTGRKVPCNPQYAFTGWNYINQGGVGEMVKRAIIVIGQALTRCGYESRIAIDMHDALVLSVKYSEAAEVIPAVRYAMCNIMPDEQNNRTNPPAQWRADFSTNKNAGKWGLGQQPIVADPPIDQSPAMIIVKELLAELFAPIEVKTTAKAQEPVKEFVDIDPESLPLTQYALCHSFPANIAPRWGYTVESSCSGQVGERPGVWLSRADARAILADLHRAFEAVHAKEFTTLIPANTNEMMLAMNVPINVEDTSLIEVAQSVHVWSAAPGRILKMAMETGLLDDDHDDLPTLTGSVGFPELIKMLNERWDTTLGCSKMEAAYNRLLDLMCAVEHPNATSFFLPFEVLQ